MIFNLAAKLQSINSKQENSFKLQNTRTQY
jgi:hypothetical protein